MMSKLKFRTQVTGKWVLAGEHSVLRGVCAVALPRRDIGLSLTFQPAEVSLSSEPSGGQGLKVDPADSQTLIEDILGAVGDALQAEGKSFTLPRGILKLESSIPIGAGLGSSAALCVALARWMKEPLSLRADDLVSFATQLEHRFHGRSSGMDVAVIAAGEAVSFILGRGVVPLGIKRLPYFTFHDTGLRSRTSDCVQKVEKFRADNPLKAIEVDEWMAEASRLAIEGLLLYDSGRQEEGLKVLKYSMQKSQDCFNSWNLVPREAVEIEKKLQAQGALAVKITGAGGGGMVVALWSDDLSSPHQIRDKT